MAQATYRQVGKVINFANDSGSDIALSDIIVLNDRVVIAADAIADGENGAVDTEGVFVFPVASAGAIDAGTHMYYDSDNEVVTATASGNTYAGVLVEDKADTATEAYIKLEPPTKQMAFIADSEAATVADLLTYTNALKNALVTAGLMLSE